MPGVGGVEATRRIVADAPSVAVLVVTMLDDEEAVFVAMLAGARGYVVRGRTGRRAPRHPARSSW